MFFEIRKFQIFRRLHVLKNANFSRNSRFLGVPILSESVYITYMIYRTLASSVRRPGGAGLKIAFF